MVLDGICAKGIGKHDVRPRREIAGVDSLNVGGVG